MSSDTKALAKNALKDIVTVLGYVSTASTFLPVMSVLRPYLRPSGVVLIIVGIFRGTLATMKAKNAEIDNLRKEKDAEINALRSEKDTRIGALSSQLATVSGEQMLEFNISAEGDPPSQKIKITANRRITVSRVEYMLSNETCIAGENVSHQEETVELPVNGALLTKVWNTPRRDRNKWDHSGPAKIGVTLSAGASSQQCILPVQMEAFMKNNTLYHKPVGSKTFRSTS